MGEDDIYAAFFMLAFYVGLPLLLLGGTWLTQHMIVRSRRKYLSEQEAYFREKIPMTNLKRFPEGNCSSSSLVTGAAVIAGNYFVSFFSAFKQNHTSVCFQHNPKIRGQSAFDVSEQHVRWRDF